MQSIKKQFFLRAKNYSTESKIIPIYKINKQYQKKASCSIQERIEKAYTKLQSSMLIQSFLLGYGNEVLFIMISKS